MAQLLSPYILCPLAFFIAVVISIYAVRKILFITRTRKLYDVPDNVRKIHGVQIPSLGGIGIFTGYIISASFFMNSQWYFITAASVMLFFTGIYDDIMNMRPSKKLIAQLLASSVAVLVAGVRIKAAYLWPGMGELPFALSVGLTIFLCTFFINVFNFMDGIDGLACTLAILYTAAMAAFFAIEGDVTHAGIALSLAGATTGLLFFNRPPARIYMGDTGSMLLGFSIFVLAVACINTADYPHFSVNFHGLDRGFIPLWVVSMLFLPVYDALRVFTLRVMRGISPLRADRLHLHYYLLDAGLSHAGAVGVIAGTNLVIMAAAWLLRNAHPALQLTSMIIIATAVTWGTHMARRKFRA